METAVIATLAGIAVLLVMSALFAGSETAFTAASQPRLHLLEKQGDARARSLNRMFGRKEQVIGGILLGNNLVNILASALARDDHPGRTGRALLGRGQEAAGSAAGHGSARGRSHRVASRQG